MTDGEQGKELEGRKKKRRSSSVEQTRRTHNPFRGIPDANSCRTGEWTLQGRRDADPIAVRDMNPKSTRFEPMSSAKNRPWCGHQGRFHILVSMTPKRR